MMTLLSRLIVSVWLCGAFALVLLPGLAIGSLTSAAGGKTEVYSSGGIPSGGFLPFNLDGTASSKGCKVNIAGGNMGNTAYQGANFLMSCDVQDTTGRFMWITQNDSASFPRTLFEIRRNGFTYANGFSIQHTQAYVQPTWYTPYSFDYGSSNAWAAFNVTTDVPSTEVPVMGLWGMQSQYGSTYPPLLRAFGQTTANGGSGTVTGTEVFSIADNGHQHVGGTGASGTLSVGTCGTSPTIAGADTAFVITLGTGTPTACTITFKQTWTSADLTCTFISESDTVSWKFTKTGSAGAWTAVTVTASAALTDGSKIHGVCLGHLT